MYAPQRKIKMKGIKKKVCIWESRNWERTSNPRTCSYIFRSSIIVTNSIWQFSQDWGSCEIKVRPACITLLQNQNMKGGKNRWFWFTQPKQSMIWNHNNKNKILQKSTKLTSSKRMLLVLTPSCVTNIFKSWKRERPLAAPIPTLTLVSQESGWCPPVKHKKKV